VPNIVGIETAANVSFKRNQEVIPMPIIMETGLASSKSAKCTGDLAVLAKLLIILMPILDALSKFTRKLETLGDHGPLLVHVDVNKG